MPSTYYVANAGSDSGTGLSQLDPWQTLAHAESVSNSADGDSLALNRGDQFRERHSSVSRNWLAYGSGADPVVNGANEHNTAGDWTEESGSTNLWFLSSVTNDPYILGVDGAVPGTRRTSKAALTGDWDWFYDSVNTRLYVRPPTPASNPTTQASSLEVPRWDTTSDNDRPTGVFSAGNATWTSIAYKFWRRFALFYGTGALNYTFDACSWRYIGSNGVQFNGGAGQATFQNGCSWMDWGYAANQEYALQSLGGGTHDGPWIDVLDGHFELTYDDGTGAERIPLNTDLGGWIRYVRRCTVVSNGAMHTPFLLFKPSSIADEIEYTDNVITGDFLRNNALHINGLETYNAGLVVHYDRNLSPGAACTDDTLDVEALRLRDFSAASTVRVSYCVVGAAAAGSNNHAGVRVTDAQGPLILNTIVLGGDDCFLMDDTGVRTPSATVKNSIFVAGRNYAGRVASGALTEDYNDWHGSVSGFTPAAHDINADPLLVNAAGSAATDFELQAGSPCVGAGVDVGLLVDYFGTAVGSPPSMGIYEPLSAAVIAENVETNDRVAVVDVTGADTSADHHELHASSVAGFTPGAGTLVAGFDNISAAAAVFQLVDDDPANVDLSGQTIYYVLRTVDVSANTADSNELAVTFAPQRPDHLHVGQNVLSDPQMDTDTFGAGAPDGWTQFIKTVLVNSSVSVSGGWTHIALVDAEGTGEVSIKVDSIAASEGQVWNAAFDAYVSGVVGTAKPVILFIWRDASGNAILPIEGTSTVITATAASNRETRQYTAPVGTKTLEVRVEVASGAVGDAGTLHVRQGDIWRDSQVDPSVSGLPVAWVDRGEQTVPGASTLILARPAGSTGQFSPVVTVHGVSTAVLPAETVPAAGAEIVMQSVDSSDRRSGNSATLTAGTTVRSPTGLNAVSTGKGGPVLGWTNVTAGATLKLYRTSVDPAPLGGPDPVPSQQVGSDMAAGTTQVQDPTLAYGATVWYAVGASDATGEAFTGWIQVTQDTGPTAPGLLLSQILATSATLAVTDNAADEDSYAVYRRTTDPAGADPAAGDLLAGGLGVNLVSYLDVNVQPNTAYWWAIGARWADNGQGTGTGESFSGWVTGVTPEGTSPNDPLLVEVAVAQSASNAVHGGALASAIAQYNSLVEKVLALEHKLDADAAATDGDYATTIGVPSRIRFRETGLPTAG